MTIFNTCGTTVKNKLYHYLVDKNPHIAKNYHDFVNRDPQNHQKHRLRSWCYLLKLNMIYRLLHFGSVPPSRPATRPLLHKPCLSCAESTITNRRLAVHMASSWCLYDVISFDIFDTLLLRPLATPTDLFYLVGERLNLMTFRKIRIDSEKEARAQTFARYGHYEVTIRDIYQIVAQYTGIDPEVGVKTELEVEMELCFANPYMLSIFKMLREQGKRIVATSDMYLPQEMMEKLLAKCGYTGFDYIFVSCDHNCSKRPGDLFEIVRQHYPEGTTFLHVGDNQLSDIEGAKGRGFATYLYRGVNIAGGIFRPEGMSPLTGSTYAGVVNAYMHNGAKQYSIPYELGFTQGGFYLLGYCHWIHRYCKEHQIDKILFVSRDGEITSKVFNQLFDDVPNFYFLWSRNATLRHGLRNINRDYCFRGLLTHWMEASIVEHANYTVKNMFDAIRVPESARKHLAEFDLKENDAILSRKENIRAFLKHHAFEIADSYAAEDEALKSYLQRAVGEAKKIVIVDVGVIGGSAMALKRLIENNLTPKRNCTVLLACYRETLDPGLAMRGDIHSYMCSPTLNPNLLRDFFIPQYGFRYACFETFHEALHPSFRNLEVPETGGSEFSFMPPEVENYPFTRELQQGILDFCRIYTQHFRNFPYLFEISGWDAFSPYRSFLPHVVAYFKRHLPNYVRAHYIPVSGSPRAIKKFTDIMKHNHV